MISDPLPAASRRDFLRSASGLLASAALPQDSKPNQQNDVQLSQIHAKSEQPERVPGPVEPADQRTGYAFVGLGRLTLGQILSAMGKSIWMRRA